MISRQSHNLRALTLLLLLLAAGPFATALAYWPGFLSWDSVRQYDQATSGKFDDWHPPAMEWLWRQLIPIHSGPAPMLLLQLALIWGGLALLAGWAWKRRAPGLAIAIAACGLMPFSIALTGEILKDCLMAGALLVATGLIAWQGDARGDLARATLPAIGIACLLFAAMLRFNAFLATVPLFIAFLPSAVWRTPLRLAVNALLAATLMLAAMPIVNRLIGAKPSGVSLSLIIFDLGGITKFSGENVFPKMAVDNPVAVATRCYEPDAWDSYSWWVDRICPINFENVRAAFAAGHTSPYLFWLKAIASHPIAYAEHRLTHVNIHARIFSRDVDERPVQIRPPPNDWGYTITPSALLTHIDDLALWSAQTPLGWPIFWIALALALAILAPRMPSRRILFPLALSALLYGSGYLVFSVASELRYHLWTMLATALATVIAAADLLGGARLGRSRLVAAAIAPLVVLVLTIGWRLTSPAG